MTVFEWRLRVYWEDTDAGGVVFYANYLKFFERARTEWLRHLGHNQQALREATGAMFMVTDTAVRYLAPARLDDELVATVAVTQHNRVTMALRQQAYRLAAGGQRTPLAEGDIRIACVDAGTLKPRRIPIHIATDTHAPTP